MAANTNIQWTDHTFNSWRGCQKVAAGCTNCYAEAQAKRNPGVLGIWGPNGTRVIASESMWKQPLKWNREAQCNCGAAGLGDRQCKWCDGGSRRPRVFCASMADVFEDWDGIITDAKGKRQFTYYDWNGTASDGSIGMTMNDVRTRLFKLIDDTPNLDWLLLTKRQENIRRMWPFDQGSPTAIFPGMSGPLGKPSPCMIRRRRENVWLGTSIAEQSDADRNVPALLKCGDLAPVLFLSIEPLVAEIDIRKVIDPAMDQHGDHRPAWVIVGGESGPHARPCHVDWIRSIVRQCKEAGAPCFVKQLGAHCLGAFDDNHGAVTGRIHFADPKGGDQAEWPEDLRVREFPARRIDGK